jgi:hypothetical protein
MNTEVIEQVHFVPAVVLLAADYLLEKLEQ